MPHLDELIGVATLAAAGMLGALALQSMPQAADAIIVRAISPAGAAAAPDAAPAPPPAQA